MPDRHMPPTLRFMLAARRSELDGLEGLAATCELVTLISQLVHALQRERGYSNIYLGSQNEDHRAHLDMLTEQASLLTQDAQQRLLDMDLEASSAADRARLFNRIAYVLHGFGELPGLRRRIRERLLTPLDATAALTRLIGGLLAVVFEAADTAIDPSITRVLVALFNFMQGKELAGQERATGVAGFSAGFFDANLHERILHLAQSQERCFQTFTDFADPQALTLWGALQASTETTQLARLREVALRTSASHPVDPGLSQLWFELYSQRVDAMQAVEQHLAEQLLSSCRQSIKHAHADLDNHRVLLQRLASLETMGCGDARLFSVQATDLDSPAPDGHGPQMGRSLLDLLQAQTHRLQDANLQLDEARQALNERKLVERAKQLLMKEYGLSENDAYARLRQSAMSRGLRMVDMAQSLLAVAGKG
jgi:hypothetical protein